MRISIESRTGPISGVASIFLFASGERLALWLDSGEAQIRDASSGRIAMALASPASRIYATEPDGPLAILYDPTTRRVELWNVVDASRVACLATADGTTAYLAPVIGASCIAFVRVRSSPTALMRFDRNGEPLGELPFSLQRVSPLLASADGPGSLPDATRDDVEIVDPIRGSRVPLERGVPAPRAAGRFQLWSLDVVRAHLACFRAGRARVWDMATGACMVGDWDGRELRHAFIVSSALCAIAPDMTFTTYSFDGRVVASGGAAVPEAERPRPALLDDRHVALLAANGHGVAIWNVMDGKEVSRIETIEGLGRLTSMTGCGGRVAVSDGHEVVILSTRGS